MVIKIAKFIAGIFFTAVIILIPCKKEFSCDACIKRHKPPTSQAGPDQVITLPTDSLTLDGSASSDPDGTISEWVWTKISGPASFIFNNASVNRTIVKKPAAGVYQFELTVTDDRGLSAKDTVQVIVNSINNPPNSSCFAKNLNWTLVFNGMMPLINPDAMAGTSDCAGYGIEFYILYLYDV